MLRKSLSIVPDKNKKRIGQKAKIWICYLIPCYNWCCFVFRVNVGCGPAEERVLLTGLHAVADIYCECCKTTLGWKYVSVLLEASPSTFDWSVFVSGARLRIEPEVQRRQIYHRISTYDQRKRLGLTYLNHRSSAGKWLRNKTRLI